jgi:hypothetical protein
VTAAGSYRPEPLTDTDRAANEDAARRAVALVAQMYLAETHGRPLNRRLRDQQVRAERLARWMARQAEGGRR